jgi:beta-glucosidase
MSEHFARAAEIVATLSIDEKIALASGKDFWNTKPLPGHASIMLTDGPHGLRKQAGSMDHVGLADSVPATCFPPAVTLGSTWDPELAQEVGAALGREARAQDVGVILGPGLNLKRHPAGGRSFEYLSEDPFHAGTMAGALTRGIQSEGVGACLKHFAVNNQETGRMRIDAIVDPRTLHELYLTGFEIAVREGRPWTVMCAYNRVNGVHTGESRELLTGILRDQWGFDGLVMTDWLATYDRPVAIHAGLDLEMPGSTGAWDKETRSALDKGRLTEEDVDLAATRVAELILRARAGRASGAEKAVDFDAHHALARRAAAAGAVLLANDGILPLKPKGKIAVIGEFARTPRYQGAGSSQVVPTRLDTFLESLTDAVGKRAEVTFAQGYDVTTGNSNHLLLEEASAAAAAADVAVVLVGLPAMHESEGYDRTSLRLPPGHDRLVEAVTAANPRTVVVLSNGAAVELPWADAPAAILESYLGGQASGAALADVILGEAEPGGRLAESFPASVRDLPAEVNWPGTPTQVEYREGLYVGYRFHDSSGVAARFPFGHGLSYTTFAFSGLKVAKRDDGARVTLTVKNTGKRAGSEVVQVYVRDIESTLYRPSKELKGFEKVHLAPGKSAKVQIDLDRRAFAMWDVGAAGWVVEAGEFEVLVGASSTDIRDRATVTIASADAVSEEAAASAAGPARFVATDEEFAAMLGRPIPAPAPLLPFHLDSTIGDLEQTAAGSILGDRILAMASDAFGSDTDEHSRKIFEAMFREMPLRGVAMASEGRLDIGRMRWVTRALNLASPKAWFASGSRAAPQID